MPTELITKMKAKFDHIKNEYHFESLTTLFVVLVANQEIFTSKKPLVDAVYLVRHSDPILDDNTDFINVISMSLESECEPLEASAQTKQTDTGNL